MGRRSVIGGGSELWAIGDEVAPTTPVAVEMIMKALTIEKEDDVAWTMENLKIATKARKIWDVEDGREDERDEDDRAETEPPTLSGFDSFERFHVGEDGISNFITVRHIFLPLLFTGFVTTDDELDDHVEGGSFLKHSGLVDFWLQFWMASEVPSTSLTAPPSSQVVCYSDIQCPSFNAPAPASLGMTKLHGQFHTDGNPSFESQFSDELFCNRERRVFTTGYENGLDGPLLGIKWCSNRPASIWELPLLAPDATTERRAGGRVRTIVSVHIESGDVSRMVCFKNSLTSPPELVLLTLNRGGERISRVLDRTIVSPKMEEALGDLAVSVTPFPDWHPTETIVLKSKNAAAAAVHSHTTPPFLMEDLTAFMLRVLLIGQCPGVFKAAVMQNPVTFPGDRIYHEAVHYWFWVHARD
ncbi:hypothetical protein BU15DRAFT_61701 [Melanogaster broomeanus]|nr:hypothetical protein BU15DRAFT_61701 [Melanogaster broomeanus]